MPLLRMSPVVRRIAAADGYFCSPVFQKNGQGIAT